MKISTKGIYALEAMVDLGIHTKEGVESIKNITSRRNLSEKYMEQIIAALKKGGLIESTRGSMGGYRLVRDASEITVFSILNAVEKNLVPLECLYRETDCGIDCEKCTARYFWQGMWEHMENIMESVTLKDLMDESKKYETPEYYI